MERIEGIRKALRDDFKHLYVKEYTAGWKENRMIRNIEIGVHNWSNLESYIKEREREAINDFRKFCKDANYNWFELDRIFEEMFGEYEEYLKSDDVPKDNLVKPKEQKDERD